jgi:multidrug efflux pump subunit AcrB
MGILVQAAIQRPITVVVVVLAVVVLGGLAIAAIAVDILPVNRSVAVQVLTFYGGMPADSMAKSVTSRVERQTGQAAGRRRQESRSIVGASIVRNYFRDEVDLNSALAQVNSLATAAYKNMPPGTDPPVILPFDPTGTTPVCVIALDSESETEETLYDVGRYEVRNMIMGLPGANAPSLHGGKRRAIVAYLDRHKLEARNLSPLDVLEALDQYNLFLPTGDVRFGDANYALGSNAMYELVEDMGDIPLTVQDGQVTFLRDVGRPSDSSIVQTSLVRVNGRRQVYIPVFRQTGASTLSVVDNLRNSLDDMGQRLSRGGIALRLVMDQSVYVRQAIEVLIEEAVLGALMCSLVILVFLGNLRMTAIAVLTIPLAVLAAVAGLYATGNTINVMTLAGLALAIGPLVDLSVICLENTHRHLGLTGTPRLASQRGTQEVALPALVATCCTLLVLAPLAFIPDLGRFLFLPMALAVGFAMIAAYLLSQTLVPVCCAAWLRPHRGHDAAAPGRHGVIAVWENTLARLNAAYAAVLARVLQAPLLVTVLAVAFLGVTVAGWGPGLRRELFPEVDSGAFEMTLRAPSGTALHVTEQRLADVEAVIHERIGDDLQLVISEAGVIAGWVAAYTPNAGTMDAVLKVQLTPHRRHSVQDHVRQLRSRFRSDPAFANLEFSFQTGGLIRTAMNEGKPTPINVRITGKDLPLLRSIAERIQGELAALEGVVDARVLQRFDYPQYTIEVDRAKAADLGLSLPYVVKNVTAALSGSIQFHKDNYYIDPRTYNQYFVGVQYAEQAIESLETLLDVPITSPAQRRAVPLRNLVALHRATIPTEVVHHEVQAAVELVMSVDGRGLGQAAADVARVLDGYGRRQADGSWVPFAPARVLAGSDAAPSADSRDTLPGSRIVLSGEYSRMQDLFRNLAAGMVLSTLLVYLLMVLLFQSFRLPLVILGSVPVGIGGVVVMLAATDTAINVQSLLGVIFMISIVVANTVLLVEFAENVRRADSLSAREAIQRAAAIRFRPVLMTALVALLALLPMAVATAHGAEANAPLGRAVIGGLLAGLVTTLLVTPCLYTLIAGTDRRSLAPSGDEQG